MTLSRQEPISEYKNKDYASRLYPTICIVFNDERVRKAERGHSNYKPHFATWDGHKKGKSHTKTTNPTNGYTVIIFIVCKKKVKGKVVLVGN
jgi:hypothetical protein